MNFPKNISKYAKHPLFLLALGVLVMFSILAYFLAPTPTQKPTSITVPTPLLPAPQTSFTTKEREYPEATPQPFPKLDGSHAGSLVVESNPPHVRVTIKAINTEETEDLSPYNQTPFKAVGIPAGHYTISATAEGYESKSVSLLLMEGEVNRITITLNPLSPTQ